MASFFAAVTLRFNGVLFPRLRSRRPSILLPVSLPENPSSRPATTDAWPVARHVRLPDSVCMTASGRLGAGCPAGADSALGCEALRPRCALAEVGPRRRRTAQALG